MGRALSRLASNPSETIGKQRFHVPDSHSHDVPRWPPSANHMVFRKPWKSLGKSTFWAIAGPQDGQSMRRPRGPNRRTERPTHQHHLSNEQAYYWETVVPTHGSAADTSGTRFAVGKTYELRYRSRTTACAAAARRHNGKSYENASRNLTSGHVI